MTETVVKIWDRFEGVVENDRQYEDPYRDVTLVSEFRSPTGQKMVFWGFYDGGNTWRFRFMPDQPGIWTYRAAFSDGCIHLTGKFLCIESDLPGPLLINSDNPQWFQHRNGKPFMIRSFHVGDCFFSANLADAQRLEFLNWAQRQGYNMLSIASHYLNRNEPGRGQGYDTPRLWPLNAKEFQRAEKILDDLAERKLVVFPFAGFFGRGSNYPTRRADQDLYIRYILARFGSYWNLLFNVAGPEPLLEKKPFMAKAEVNRLGRLIRSMDLFHHPITVHNRTGDDQFIDQDWPTYTTLQGPKTTDLEVLYTGIRRNVHPDRPLFAQETLWSGNKYHPNYSDEQLRKNAYVIHFSGGFLNFIDNGEPTPEKVGDSSAGFSGSLKLSDCCQWRHDIIKNVWDTLETFPLSQMRPAQQVVNDGYCLADIGEYYLAYLPKPGTIQLNIPEGDYSAQWIDARDPNNRFDAGKYSSGSSLTPPDGGDDWLLFIHRSQ